MKMEILKRALNRESFFDMQIIDSHCHMGSWYSYYFPKANIEEMMEDADKMGIAKLCIAPHASLSCDYRLGNVQLLEAVAKYPDRVLGLLAVNGNMPDEIHNEFDKYFSKKQFVGIKIHPSLHKSNVAGNGYHIAYEKLEQLGGYVLTHSWDNCPYCSVELCETAIKIFPRVPFVLAHAGGTYEGVEKAIKLVNNYENAFIDTSGFEFSDTCIEKLVSQADKSKILFGSDIPFHDIRSGVSRILFSNLDDATKEDILGGNFRRMLKLNPKRV